MQGNREEPVVLNAFWFTVTQITGKIKYLLEDSIQPLWIMGELSNVKLHRPSGHLYFSLRDKDSTLRSVMFRRDVVSLGFQPVEGEMVLAYGRVTVFARQGQYELIAEEMVPAGKKGLTAAKLEVLKAQLIEEGLFDSSRKQSLPKFPVTVGVVTSPTGAAIRDIMRVMSRRWSAARILLSPTLVQGEDAPTSIARAIGYQNEFDLADVLIVGRGGGAKEDLSCFNEEVVVRAIANSRIPVVSAIGHETDITLSDLAADVRAPTPSAAAELVVPNRADLGERVRTIEKRLERALQGKKNILLERLLGLSASHGLRAPRSLVQQRAQRLDDLAARLRMSVGGALELKERSLTATGARLQSLDPKAVLERGYTICLDLETKLPLGAASSVTENQLMELLFHDGEVECQATRVATT